MLSCDVCDNINSAYDKLKASAYDLMILDINLPQRHNESPKRDAGITLLNRVLLSNKYITPSNIIAITAYKDISEQYSSVFNEHAVLILDYSVRTESWKNPIRSKLSQIYNAKATRVRERSKTQLLITVHGIRTFGEWQNRLKRIVNNVSPNINVISYKYGYFSVLAYLVPIFRKYAANKFKKQLIQYVNEANITTIDIVAHSFGTYIVATAIKAMQSHDIKIRNIIFAGSVLPANYDWQNLLSTKSVQRLINDCGKYDIPLVLNGLLVPFVGSAGYTGFIGMNSDILVNRYFNGGHCHYFVKNGNSYDDFMEQYWLPVIITDESTPIIDQRGSPNIFTGIFAAIISNSTIIKTVLYSIIVYYIVSKYTKYI